MQALSINNEKVQLVNPQAAMMYAPTAKGLFVVDLGALPGQWVHAARRAALVSMYEPGSGLGFCIPGRSISCV